ncbi:MAG: hypothetical protein FWC79_08055 [Oscillospiraceae bacterium]|nr:hypothetical protein [Oscillospiraceae bacterium]
MDIKYIFFDDDASWVEPQVAIMRIVEICEILFKNPNKIVLLQEAHFENYMCVEEEFDHISQLKTAFVEKGFVIIADSTNMTCLSQVAKSEEVLEIIERAIK